MNRKGFSIIAIPFGILGFFVILIVFTVVLANQEGASYEELSVALDWDKMNSTQQFKNQTNNTIINVAYRAVDFAGYTTFELAKGAAYFNEKNPDLVNAKNVITLMFMALLAPIIFYGARVLIIIGVVVHEGILSWSERRKRKSIKKDSSI